MRLEKELRRRKIQPINYLEILDSASVDCAFIQHGSSIELSAALS
jgi:hypothetical protein